MHTYTSDIDVNPLQKILPTGLKTLMIFRIATKATTYTMHVGWKCLRAICLAERFLFWKGNDNGWWGSPGRYGSSAILNVNCMRTYLRTYPAGFIIQQFSLGTRPHESRTQKLCLNFGWECSVPNEFVARNDSRIRIFGHYWASIFVCNTAYLYPESCFFVSCFQHSFAVK